MEPVLSLKAEIQDLEYFASCYIWIVEVVDVSSVCALHGMCMCFIPAYGAGEEGRGTSLGLGLGSGHGAGAARWVHPSLQSKRSYLLPWRWEVLPELPFVSVPTELGTPFSRILVSVHLCCVRSGSERSDCPSQMQPLCATKSQVFFLHSVLIQYTGEKGKWLIWGALSSWMRLSPGCRCCACPRTCEQPPADARSLLQSRGPGKARRALPLQGLAGGEKDVGGKHSLAQNWAIPWINSGFKAGISEISSRTPAWLSQRIDPDPYQDGHATTSEALCSFASPWFQADFKSSWCSGDAEDVLLLALCGLVLFDLIG